MTPYSSLHWHAAASNSRETTCRGYLEAPEAGERRLTQDRARRRQCLASESVAETETCGTRHRVRERAWCAAQSS